MLLSELYKIRVKKDTFVGLRVGAIALPPAHKLTCA